MRAHVATVALILVAGLALARPVDAGGDSNDDARDVSRDVSEHAVEVCEASAWGRAYRAGCRDMCTLVTVESLADAGVDARAAFAEARESCSAHCYEFCTGQLGRLERFEREPAGAGGSALPQGSGARAGNGAAGTPGPADPAPDRPARD